jgi:hypothetical protein
MAPLAVANVAANGTVIRGGDILDGVAAPGGPAQAVRLAVTATIARTPADRILTRLTPG